MDSPIRFFGIFLLFVVASTSLCVVLVIVFQALLGLFGSGGASICVALPLWFVLSGLAMDRIWGWMAQRWPSK